MTDPDLLAQKLAFIETCVQDLRTLARPAEILRDVREARFVLHTLQIAIQAALDAWPGTVGSRPTWRQPWGEWPASATSSFTATAA